VLARDATLAAAIFERDDMRRKLARPSVRVTLLGEALLDAIGIVSAVGFAPDVSQCRELCRLTWRVAQRGDTASMKHSLDQISLSTQRAEHMVNQLLAMARADAASGQVLQHQPVDLAALVRSVVRDFVAKAMDRRIDLGYEGPEDGSATTGLSLLGEPVLLFGLVGVERVALPVLAHEVLRCHRIVQGALDSLHLLTPRVGSVRLAEPHRFAPRMHGLHALLEEGRWHAIHLQKVDVLLYPHHRLLGRRAHGHRYALPKGGCDCLARRGTACCHGEPGKASAFFLWPFAALRGRASQRPLRPVTWRFCQRWRLDPLPPYSTRFHTCTILIPSTCHGFGNLAAV
jgi:hypothetical protein